MKTAFVIQNQTLFDLAVLYFGSAEGIFPLMDDNPHLTWWENPAPGTEIKIKSTPLDPRIVDYFAAKESKPATQVSVAVQKGTINIIDQNKNPLGSFEVAPGDNITEAVTVVTQNPDLQDYTCQKLKDGLSIAQKICVRNQTYFTSLFDGEIDIISIDNQNVVFSGNNSGTTTMAYAENAERYFVPINTGRIRIYDKNWVFITQITLQDTNLVRNIVYCNGFIWVVKSTVATNLGGLIRINPFDYTQTQFGNGRLVSIIAIGDLLYIMPGIGHSVRRLWVFNTNTNTYSSTLSSLITEVNTESRMSYDGNDIIGHMGFSNSVVSFYRISDNSNIANVSVSGIFPVVLFHPESNCWYIVTNPTGTQLGGVTVISNSTYTIIETYRTANILAFGLAVLYDKTIISSGTIGLNGSSINVSIHFNIETKRFYFVDYAGPFLIENDNTVTRLINDFRLPLLGGARLAAVKNIQKIL